MQTPWMDAELRRRWRALPAGRRMEIHGRLTFGQPLFDPEDRELAVELARHRRHQLAWGALLGPPAVLLLLWALQPLLGSDASFGEFVTDPWNWALGILFLWILPLFDARRLRRIEERNSGNETESQVSARPPS